MVPTGIVWGKVNDMVMKKLNVETKLLKAFYFADKRVIFADFMLNHVFY